MPKRRSTPDELRNKAKAIVSELMKGHSAHSALENAGFTGRTTHKGLAATFRDSPKLADEVNKEIARWLPAIKSLPVAQLRAGLARTRLVMNVLQGTDKAVQSIKLLGQDREVNMFEPEVRIGMAINVMPPGEWQSRYITSESASEPKDPAES